MLNKQQRHLISNNDDENQPKISRNVSILCFLGCSVPLATWMVFLVGSFGDVLLYSKVDKVEDKHLTCYEYTHSCQHWIRKPQTPTIYYRSHMCVYKRRCLEIPFWKAFSTKYFQISVYIIRSFCRSFLFRS